MYRAGDSFGTVVTGLETVYRAGDSFGTVVTGPKRVNKAGDSFATVVTGPKTGEQSRIPFWNSSNRTGIGCTKRDTVFEQL